MYDSIKNNGRLTLPCRPTVMLRKDPKTLLFTMARHKTVSKMLKGYKSVLEVGCGDGFASRLIQTEIESLYSIDYDPFFISEANYDPSIPSYADQIKNGVRMFNSSNALNQNCLAAYPGEEWKCFMAQYMAPYVRQQLFIVQSRFDEFQLMELLGLPCFAGQAYVPPFVPSNCTNNEKLMIKSFGERLYTLLMGAISKKPDNGLWLVSCIQHNVVCNMHNTNEGCAFTSWWHRGQLGKNIGYRWVDDCEDGGKTPCNTGKMCAPPHF